MGIESRTRSRRCKMTGRRVEELEQEIRPSQSSPEETKMGKGRRIEQQKLRMEEVGKGPVIAAVVRTI